MSEKARKLRLEMRGFPRFLAAAVLVALMYVGLQEAWLAIFSAIFEQGATPDEVLTGPVQREAARISVESAAKEASLTVMHRRVAFQLGYQVGYGAGARGSTLTWSDAERAQLDKGLVPREQAASQLAEFLRIGDIQWLPVRNLGENLRLPNAIEADENAQAARIEAATTPRHKELYLLGAHTGVLSAQIDIAAVHGGRVWPVPPLAIARHAALAGVPRALWSPLLHVPVGQDPLQVSEAYRRSVIALETALGDANAIHAPQVESPAQAR